MLERSSIAELAGGFRGALIQPEGADYEAARRIYNAMIDRRPALIARCSDAADVIAAVRFAREHDLPLAVRGGGHSAPGLCTCDDGMVVDLSAMDGRRVDPARRTVRAEGGSTWGAVDHATHAFGRATPSGFISTTGVGGLTLGGGIGYLARRHGLSIDNLLGVDMVLADGRFVTASENENADLFWAVRGGGGNFGVVTSFEFRLHEVDTVFGGPMLWPLDRAPEVMKRWQDFILEAPEDINGWFGFMTVPPAPPFPEAFHLQKMCAVTWCYLGPLDQKDERFAPVRDFGEPAIDFTGPLPFPALQSMFDAFYPPGLHWYWKGDFFESFSEEAIARHLEHAAKLPTALSTMHLYPINGAVHRVGSEETAFSFRDANFAEVIVGVDRDPSSCEQMIAWSREYWDAMHPHSAGGSYVNLMMDEGQEQVRAAYRGNYDRLREIKARYDPQNLFRINQNIQPSV